MKRPLWAPWRIDYIRSKKNGGCFLCDLFSSDLDRDNLLLFRGTTCAVVMNRYPYASGHLMVTPMRHIAELGDLTDAEALELTQLTSKTIQILRDTLNPDGFNVGINLGTAAGAGLKDHLHQHIVPRWDGDNNFMPVLGGPRVMPEALIDTYDFLLEHFNAL